MQLEKHAKLPSNNNFYSFRAYFVQADSAVDVVFFFKWMYELFYGRSSFQLNNNIRMCLRSTRNSYRKVQSLDWVKWKSFHRCVYDLPNDWTFVVLIMTCCYYFTKKRFFKHFAHFDWFTCFNCDGFVSSLSKKSLIVKNTKKHFGMNTNSVFLSDLCAPFFFSQKKN